MKKNVALLTGFLFLAFVLHAQKKQPKFLTELSIGPSFPIGKFAATSYKDDNSERPGWAKPGLAAHLSVGYYLNKSVGVLLSSGYSVHSLNKKAYKHYIEEVLPGIPVTNMDAKSWKTVKLMAGGFLVTPLTLEEKLVLLTKLTAGVSKTAEPEVTWNRVSQTPGWTSSGERKKVPLPWSFCYQVSLALEYKLNHNLYVLLDISSFNTKAEKEFTYIASTGQDVVVKETYKQATVNALVGIGVRF